MPAQQRELLAGQVHVGAVEALGLGRGGQAEEQHDDVGVRGRGDGLGGQRRSASAASIAKPGANATSRRRQRRRAARRARVSTRVGLTCELPAPW